jgi:hypothetical protein
LVGGFPNQQLSDSSAVGLKEGLTDAAYALRDDQWDPIKDFLPGREAMSAARRRMIRRP